MKLNEKNVASFAVCSSPVDKEGYLLKKGDLNKDFQRRWFILKGNLLFYFQKKQDKEPLGVVVLEACSVQISTHGRYSFEISFDGPGTRTYVFGADNDEDLQSWIKAISHSSYEYLRSIVNELQRRVNTLTSSSSTEDASGMSLLHVGAINTTSRTPQRSRSEKVQPTAQKKKLKVKNGILVDVDELEAPPLPAKKKSNTIHHTAVTSKPEKQGDVQGGGSTLMQFDKSDDDEADVEDNADAGSREEAAHLGSDKLRTVQTMSSAPPHSSPYVPARMYNPSKPLSPVATLDRTPVLEPIPAVKIPTSPPPLPKASTTSQNSSPAEKDNDYDEVPPSLPPRPEHNGVLTSPAPILPSPPPPSRQVSAPLDPNKSMYDMHTEFTEAMNALRSERSSKPPQS